MRVASRSNGKWQLWVQLLPHDDPTMIGWNAPGAVIAVKAI
jgi:hypothetical protein